MSLQRFIVYGLRHDPEKLGVVLDKEGYCSVDSLLESMGITRSELGQIIRDSGFRLCLSEDGKKIRAAHGHSVDVSMSMSDSPPSVLYHGTSPESISGILAEGISSMSRAYVHLSETATMALRVGSRHSKNSVAIFSVDAKRMREDGIGFHKSEDGVWLVAHVPPKYLKLLGVRCV